MLQRSEQGVELRKMCAVVGLEDFNLGTAFCESSLKIERRERKNDIHHPSQTEVAIDNAFGQSL